MFYNIAFTASRRVLITPAVTRPLLTRSISYTPTLGFPTKSATSATKSTKSTPKAKTTTKAEATAGNKTKAIAKGRTTKSKTEGVKEKKAEKKARVFTREELKVPPRPSMTGYIFFSGEERAKLDKPKTLEESGNITRTLSQRWSNFNDEEKQVYNTKAEAETTRRAKEWKEWLTNIDPAVLRKINTNRMGAGKRRIVRHYDDNRSKQPTPAYFRFYQNFLRENPSVIMREATQKAAAVWNELPEEKKRPFRQMYEEEKKAYDLEQRAHHKAQESV